jgi:hypothetical protein
VTGQHSLLIKAYVSDTEHLAKLLEKTQQFGNTETSVVMYENIKTHCKLHLGNILTSSQSAGNGGFLY